MSFSSSTPIRCRSCDFAFEARVSELPTPVFCPSCGDEFVCRGAVREVVAEVPNAASPVPLSGDHPRRWGVLFSSVCIQLVVLILVAGFLLFKNDTGKERPTRKTTEESSANTPHEAAKIVKTPDAAPAQAGPAVARKVEPVVDTKKEEAKKLAEEKKKEEEAKKLAEAKKEEEAKKLAEAKKEEEAKKLAEAKKKEEEAKKLAEAKKKEEEAKKLAEAKKKEEEAKKLAEAKKKEEEAKKLAETKKKEEEEAKKAKPSAAASPGEKPSERPLSQYDVRLGQAKAKLADASDLIAIDPERGLVDAIQAVEMFRELGQAIPPSAYWIIGQAYASQSWGEALIEASPPIENMAISSDSHWLLTQCSDNTVWIWDIFRSQKSLEGFKLDSGDRAPVKVLFTPDLRLAIGGSADGVIRIWNTTLKNPAESAVTFRETVPGLRDLQISPDGRWLVACGGSASDYMTVAPPAPPGTARRETKRPGEIILVNYQNPPKETDNQAPSPKEDPNVVFLWDLNLLQNGIVPQPVVLRGHERPIRVMEISADSRWLVTGSDDATARIYSLRGVYPGADQAVLKGHELGITAVAVDPTGRWVATGSRDNTIRLWTLPDTKTPPVCSILDGHLGWISSLIADSKGERLISGSYDKTIRIWKIANDRIDQAAGQDPLVIQNDQGAVRQLLLTEDGKTLVSLGGDASLRLRSLDGDVDPKHSVMIRNRMLPITKIAITPDNRWIVFNYVNQRDPANSGVRLWPLRFENLAESASAFGNETRR